MAIKTGTRFDSKQKEGSSAAMDAKGGKKERDAALVALDAAAAAAKELDAAAAADALAAQLAATLSVGSSEERRAAAFSVGGTAKSAGADALAAAGAVGELRRMFGERKDAGSREAAAATFEGLVRGLGWAFEPAALELFPLLVAAQGDSDKDARKAALKAGKTFFSKCSAPAAKLAFPMLLVGMHDKQWRTKEGCLKLVKDIAKAAPAQMEQSLPAVMPAMMDSVADTHDKVHAAAVAAMPTVCGVVQNAETQTLMELFVGALTRPDKETAACLERLMDITFVNSIDSPSLALMVPVMLRSLRDRKPEIMKQACQTASNIFNLVMDPASIAPFAPPLAYEINKALNHDQPEVRAAAEVAMDVLTKGLGDTKADAVETKAKATVAAIEEAATKAIAEWSLAPELAAHAAKLCGAYEGTPRLSPVASALQAALKPIAKSAGVESARVAELAKAMEKIVRDAQGSPQSNVHPDPERDYLVQLEGIILAFTGRVLLRRTSLLLERGRRYGIVGQNGVGKTTLLTRVAARDINGFPADVKCYYVAHEILSEKDDTVINFMRGMVPKGTSEETLVSSLTDVGFSDAMREGPVSALSGGWRMKLAIARSMLHEPDLLILDEPTNHLDVKSVAWLTEYLQVKLPGVTVLVVSHEYTFLDDVCTNIIHIHDQMLSYHDCGFNDFQAANPEIVAGLPTVENAAKKADAAAEKDLEARKAELGTGAKSEAAPTAEEAAAAKEAERKRVEEANRPSALPIVFPDGGVLEGLRTRSKPVMKAEGMTFGYTPEKLLLNDVSVKLTRTARLALTGVNGAGKTTLMKLLFGEMDPLKGEVWKHHNLRMSYVAQHSMHHLEDNLDTSPIVYIQQRFFMGQDREVAKMDFLKLTEEEEEMRQKPAEINAVVGRQERGKDLFYELTKNGHSDKTFWEPLQSLKYKASYVLKLCKNYDEKMKAEASGLAIRPITVDEVRKHLNDFGIGPLLADSKIRRFSAGQRSRLVLAAAMWSKPHLIALDEPTNYLDNDTLAALTKALRDFKGGVVVISHNQAFIDSVCNEVWRVEDGTVKMIVDPNEGKRVKKSRFGNSDSTVSLASMVSSTSTASLDSLA